MGLQTMVGVTIKSQSGLILFKIVKHGTAKVFTYTKTTKYQPFLSLSGFLL